MYQYLLLLPQRVRKYYPLAGLLHHPRKCSPAPGEELRPPVLYPPPAPLESCNPPWAARGLEDWRTRKKGVPYIVVYVQAPFSKMEDLVSKEMNKSMKKYDFLISGGLFFDARSSI